MITLFREFTKSWIFTVLMGFLILSFAVFGLKDVFSQVGGNNVVTAGSRSVSVQEFKQTFDNYKQRYASEHNGQPFTNEQFVAEGAHLSMLEQIADETALAAWLDKQGVKPSAKLLVEQISKQPAFFNNTTGKFDKTVYREALARARFDEKTYERNIRDGLAGAQYASAALAGLKAPRIYGATESAFLMQTRDFSYFMVGPESVPAVPQPTDADIAAFYKEHHDQMVIPELRQASVVVMNVAQFEQGIQPNEEELKKAYQAKLPTLKTPETRSFVQVTATDMGAANKIADALKSGQTPEAAAKANKGTVIAFDDKGASSVPDSKVAEAAFAMKTGDVSAPIKGDLGISVVKMGNIRIGSTPSYESLRAQLADEYRKEKAADKLNTVSHAFADAIAAGDNFEATAQKLGLRVDALLPMTAEGKAQDPRTGQPVDYSRYGPLVQGVFDLQQGATSDVEEMGNGQYFAIKLNVIHPAGAPPIDKVKPQLAQAWWAQKTAAAVQDKAQSINDRLKAGESFAKIAAEVHAPVKTMAGLDRQSGQQKVGPQAIARIFMAKPGESLQVQVDQGHFVIGRVDAIHQAEASAANTTATVLRPRLAQMVAQDIDALTRAAARKTVKTATYPDTVLRALDVAVPDAKGGAKDTKDKPKS